jgi:Mg/Co/Ni transporter MgtE
LAGPQRELRRLRPGDIADLLEELGRAQRQELLDVLDEDTAADVLEELGEDNVVRYVRDAPTDRAAGLLAAMQPDEAVDALRALDDRDRDELLAAMDPATATELRRLLAFRAGTAGGLMTPVVVAVEGDATVTQVRQTLRDHADHSGDIDGVLVVDTDGRVLDDVSLFELLLAEPEQRMLELVGEPWPITVGYGVGLDEVLDALVDNRRSAVVVVDDGRPIGRILADDLIDAIAERPRSPFTRMPS